ncbi:hypothetical protein O1611_g6309 [Lasiodiplodia mahajangana]|uniref:Uncharacterized protein n=1 Tax=Lasiodiplodia mahajangana TaxID=1108764 RepID=A0ACC2JIK0_9PEZI|nr:hypothetical protein O1611_g6309 [Lasiodiplodia mahajangana]
MQPLTIANLVLSILKTKAKPVTHADKTEMHSLLTTNLAPLILETKNKSAVFVINRLLALKAKKAETEAPNTRPFYRARGRPPARVNKANIYHLLTTDLVLLIYKTKDK